MIIARHQLQVFERPRTTSYTGSFAAGTFLNQARWLKSYRAENYRHRLVAKGGYDSASCTIRVRREEAEYIFSELIGCVVRVYADDPINPIFEGYIDRVTYRAGSVTLTRSVENMANQVNVTYYNVSSPAAIKTENIDTATGTTLTNSKSIATYGLKLQNLDAGLHYNNAVKDHKTMLRQTTLAVRAWPQISVAMAQGGEGIIELEMRGLHYMAFDWEQFDLTETDPLAFTLDMTVVMYRLIIDSVHGGGALLPQNAPYIYRLGPLAATNPWLRYVNQSNMGAQMSIASQSGGTYLQFLMSILEAGNGSQQYAFRILPPDHNEGQRYIYWQPASSTVRYQVNALRDTGHIRDMLGKIVPGWRVQPDSVVQLNDVMIGYTESGDDPRKAYISAVEYDGNTGMATFQSGDNITMEGVLQRDRYFKDIGQIKAFSAPPRRVL